jgi:hypothetical protein
VSTGSPRQLWLLPVLLITVIATALGALLARGLYADPPPQPPAAVEPSPSSTLPPNEQPGSPRVEGTVDATTHPLYSTLRPLLQQYFDAINAKDFASWAETVTKERLKTTNEDKWYADYDTTTDGSIVIYRIETGGDGSARVLLQFTSVQDVSDAPKELPKQCIHWNLVWPFLEERGEWKLSAGDTSRSPQHEACAGT